MQIISYFFIPYAFNDSPRKSSMLISRPFDMQLCEQCVLCICFLADFFLLPPSSILSIVLLMHYYNISSLIWYRAKVEKESNGITKCTYTLLNWVENNEYDSKIEPSNQTNRTTYMNYRAQTTTVEYIYRAIHI